MTARNSAPMCLLITGVAGWAAAVSVGAACGGRTGLGTPDETFVGEDAAALDAPVIDVTVERDAGVEAEAQAPDAGTPPDARDLDRTAPMDAPEAFDAPTVDSPPDASCAVCASSLGASGAHTCAVTGGGAVVCWGDDEHGEVGDGLMEMASSPTAVEGLSSGFVAVVAGEQHTCALDASGGVRCWGYNASGQLGDGTKVDRSTPVDVTGLPSPVVALGAGNDHSCAVTSLGAVWCWGDNSYGQLGNGSTTSSASPVAVTGLTSGAVAVVAGVSHTCALLATGQVRCWGFSDYGQVGSAVNGAGSKVPVSVSGLAPSIVALAAAGDHTCALSSAGGVQCWGNQEDGELGNDAGASTPTPVPVDVSGLSSGVVAITAGFVESCALTNAGAVMCWGHGQFGPTLMLDVLTPAVVAGFESGIRAIAAGFYHLCAVTSAGGIRCAGDDEHGQLGDDMLNDSTTPVEVVGF